MTDADFAEQKKPGMALFQNAVGYACSQLKDYPCAVAAFKTVLTLTPTDAVASLSAGSCVPRNEAARRHSMDSGRSARAINLKIPDSDKIKDYLRRQILAYEQPGCDSLADAQLNELLQLSANSPDRPATYTDSERGRSEQDSQLKQHPHRHFRSERRRRQSQDDLACALRRRVS